ncbi:MAG: 23S rRNA (adenine(2503)-C(2))-methyltransferase RlmN [Bacillota bacterium]
MGQKKDIRSYNINDIEKFLETKGFKKFRAKQIFRWISKGIEDFEKMKNIPNNLIVVLKDKFILKNMAIEKTYESKDNTKKFLLKLSDGNIIEAVLMKYKHGYTICISTQVGCKMGCTFCASTIGGKVRNLTSGEMLGQIFTLQNKINEKIGNVVLMGSGEPLDNFKNVVKFLNLVNHSKGLNISHRKITVSTVGIVPKIYKLADLNLQITLAISLHEVSNNRRSEIIPVNQKYPIEDILEACRYYIKKTNRRITFEYSLINRVNDNYQTAIRLGELLKGMLCHVNLIPINKVEEKNYLPAKEKNIKKFKKALEEFNITVTIRREMGSDINAACGQLRNNYSKKN